MDEQFVFIVPLGADEDRCYNDITPKNQDSSFTCAWSGACIVFGGMAADVWGEPTTAIRTMDVADSEQFSFDPYGLTSELSGT